MFPGLYRRYRQIYCLFGSKQAKRQAGTHFAKVSSEASRGAEINQFFRVYFIGTDSILALLLVLQASIDLSIIDSQANHNAVDADAAVGYKTESVTRKARV